MIGKPLIACMFAFLFAMPMQALPALPPAATGERCNAPATGTPLPSLHIEICPACELAPVDIAAWQQAYLDAARTAGHSIDSRRLERVRITETGLLANGTPYAIGETAGLRFRVGDPHPGATLGTALGRMSFVILSGTRERRNMEALE